MTMATVWCDLCFCVLTIKEKKGQVKIFSKVLSFHPQLGIHQSVYTPMPINLVRLQVSDVENFDFD